MDGSDGSRLALEWALDEARLRSAEVLAVYAWVLVPVAVPGPAPTLDWDVLQESAEAFLQGFVADAAGEHPHVAVRSAVVGGPAAEALVQAARGAEMLVVGSRGLGGFRELLLGSVSHQCTQHASCPVVVVHGERVAATEPHEQAELMMV